MTRRFLDTNLVVRYLVQDHPAHRQAATRLFEACDQGKLGLVVLPAVLAETVFVLESFYEKPRADIVRVLSQLLSSPGVELPEGAIHLDALQRYGSTGLHFVDCTVAAFAARHSLAVATFDKQFRKFPDVEVDTDL